MTHKVARFVVIFNGNMTYTYLEAFVELITNLCLSDFYIYIYIYIYIYFNFIEV